jgi:recombination protein RecT
MPPTAIQKPQQRVTLEDLLNSRRDLIAQLIPKHLTPDRLMKTALVAYARSPQLRACDVNSILKCVVQCAELGLEPNTPLGLAYLVPFKTECTLIVGYRGLINLARRTGELLQVEAHPVRKGDKFRVRYGSEPVLEHEPLWEDDARDVLAFYALARLANGERQVEVMSRSSVDAIRDRSRASKNGPWVTDYDEMGKKTVVRRMMKYLPMNPHLARAMEVDADRDENEPIELNAAPVPATGTKAERLKAELQAQRNGEPYEVGAEDAPPHDPDTGELPPEEAPEPGTDADPYSAEFETLAKLIDSATDKPALTALTPRIQAFGNSNERLQLQARFTKRSRELK